MTTTQRNNHGLVDLLWPRAARRLDRGAAKTAVRILISEFSRLALEAAGITSSSLLFFLNLLFRTTTTMMNGARRPMPAPPWPSGLSSIRKLIQAIEYAQSFIPAFFCWAIVASMAILCYEFVFKLGVKRSFPFSGWDSNSIDWNPLQPHLIKLAVSSLSVPLCEADLRRRVPPESSGRVDFQRTQIDF